MYQTSFSAFLDSLDLSQATDFPPVRVDPYSTCLINALAHMFFFFLNTCGYENATVSTVCCHKYVLGTICFCSDLAAVRTGGGNYLRKHIVKIRLQCKHCVGVTLLRDKFKNEVISDSRCTSVYLLSL